MVEEIIEEEPESAEKDEEVKDGETKDAEKPEKKKKIKKTLLEFTESRPIEWTKADIEKAFEAEVAMTNADRIIRETADMRNELESYIYDMRDKIISELATYLTEDEKSTFSTALEAAENWLYEDGFDATKSVYAEKLSGLQKFGSPIVFRHTEATNRPNAISVLQRTVEKYNNWLNSSQGEDEYAHITYEEFTKCHDKCDEASSWMYDMMDKQGSVALNVDPLVTVAEINAKVKDLTNVVSPVMHKPKPKPKKKEEPASDEKKEETAKDEKKDKSETMETDEKPAAGSEPMDTTQ